MVEVPPGNSEWNNKKAATLKPVYRSHLLGWGNRKNLDSLRQFQKPVSLTVSYENPDEGIYQDLSGSKERTSGCPPVPEKRGFLSMEFFFGSKPDLKSVSGLFFEAAVERKVHSSFHL